VNPETRVRARDPALLPAALGSVGKRMNGRDLHPGGVGSGVAAVVFLNNRYHDPTLGRFISVDPLIATTRDAYGYASNNPITKSDPTGLEAGSWLDSGDDAWAWGYLMGHGQR
jgi:RHS repeat-associated protein